VIRDVSESNEPREEVLGKDSGEQSAEESWLPEGDSKVSPCIDSHIHIWRYPSHFNKEIMLKHQPARRMNWTEERWKAMWDSPAEKYIRQTDGVVERAVIQGMTYLDAVGISVPNDDIADIVKQYPDQLSWCCCVDPTTEGAAEEIDRCVTELGAVGVGELGPTYHGYYVNDPRCYEVWAKVQDLGVPVFIHAGPAQPRFTRLKYGNPLLIDDIAIDFPDLKIVLCHIGYYKYEDTIFLLQKHDNVFADVSWLQSLSAMDRSSIPRYLPVVRFPYYHLLQPLLYYFSQTFGITDKLLFGTDWPSSPPRNSIKILTGINDTLKQYHLPQIPQASINNILRENWKKVFNFPAKEIQGTV